jgi:hypothetical protein
MKLDCKLLQGDGAQVGYIADTKIPARTTGGESVIRRGGALWRRDCFASLLISVPCQQCL